MLKLRSFFENTVNPTEHQPVSEPAGRVSIKEVGAQVATGYRELTVAAVVLGIIQGIVLNLAFVYAALKLGFSIAGSTVAAIMGYALLTGVMKRGTSVENNINQTTTQNGSRTPARAWTSRCGR
jgi:uncharacterized oligopeptide transporter (OPT) family protein